MNINKLQEKIIKLGKELKDIEVKQESLNLKEIAVNGIATAIGALELIKMNESDKEGEV